MRQGAHLVERLAIDRCVQLQQGDGVLPLGRAAEVEATGVRCVVAPTIMRASDEAAALARVTLTC